jgi:hypothetical protein
VTRVLRDDALAHKRHMTHLTFGDAQVPPA